MGIGISYKSVPLPSYTFPGNVLHLKKVIHDIHFNCLCFYSTEGELNTTSTAEKKAQDYYMSCLDEDEIIEELGATPLLKLIDSVRTHFIPHKIVFSLYILVPYGYIKII